MRDDISEPCMSIVEKFFVILGPVIVNTKLNIILNINTPISVICPLLQVIPYTSIESQEGVCIWIARVCKIVPSFGNLEIHSLSILLYHTVQSAAFPARQDINEFEVERTSRENVLRDYPFAITEWHMSIFGDKCRDVCPIYCKEAVFEVWIVVLQVQDKLRRKCVLSWQFYICTVNVL